MDSVFTFSVLNTAGRHHADGGGGGRFCGARLDAGAADSGGRPRTPPGADRQPGGDFNILKKASSLLGEPCGAGTDAADPGGDRVQTGSLEVHTNKQYTRSMCCSCGGPSSGLHRATATAAAFHLLRHSGLARLARMLWSRIGHSFYDHHVCCRPASRCAVQCGL